LQLLAEQTEAMKENATASTLLESVPLCSYGYSAYFPVLTNSVTLPCSLTKGMVLSRYVAIAIHSRYL